MSEPIFKVACPSCGAPVHFRSATSAMAVCSYCQSRLVRDTDTVRDIGKISAVLPDYSPIQIGTSGVFEGQPFTVVGRLQLQYEDGCWNEWYVAFDTGDAGWLGDASGQYMLTREAPLPAGIAQFSDWKAADRLDYAGQIWTAGDVRIAHWLGGVGELPFVVTKALAVRAVDLRSGADFMTLDWSTDTPRCYRGKSVTLDSLRCQFLRDGYVIANTAGKLQGRIRKMNCGGCGSPMRYAPGLADFYNCPACGTASRIDAGTATVLESARRAEQHQTSLQLGDSGNIDGLLWDVLGIMRRQELPAEGAEVWNEYLLFNVTRGFLWLVEAASGWSRVEVMNAWPTLTNAATAELGGEVYMRQYDYGGRVVWATGAFYWRVKAGDDVRIADYRKGDITLTSEHDRVEMTWSRGIPVTAAQLKQWFNLADQRLAPPPSPHWWGRASDIEKIAAACSVLLGALNLPLLFSSGFPYAFTTILCGVVLLWLPIIIANET